MTLHRRLLASDLLRSLLAWLAARYIGLVWRSTRWRYERAGAGDLLPQAGPSADKGKPFIAAYWHGRLQLAHDPSLQPARLSLLVSEHRDGRLIGMTAEHLGYTTVGVSRRRGGGGALRRLQRALTAGQSVVITPDGPRGPRMRAKRGAIKLAQLTGAPILPLSASVRRGRNIGSWDRFLLAWPFNRGVVLWGEPMQVPADADAAQREALRRQLEDRLNALTAEADRICGRPPVMPAAPPPADSEPDGVDSEDGNADSPLEPAVDSKRHARA